MRQQRWLEFMKDYDVEIHHHPGKANVVVVNALSGKTTTSLACTLVPRKISGLPTNIIVEPTLIEEIRARKSENKCLKKYAQFGLHCKQCDAKLRGRAIIVSLEEGCNMGYRRPIDEVGAFSTNQNHILP